MSHICLLTSCFSCSKALCYLHGSAPRIQILGLCCYCFCRKAFYSLHQSPWHLKMVVEMTALGQRAPAALLRQSAAPGQWEPRRVFQLRSFATPCQRSRRSSQCRALRGLANSHAEHVTHQHRALRPPRRGWQRGQRRHRPQRSKASSSTTPRRLARLCRRRPRRTFAHGPSGCSMSMRTSSSSS